MHLDYGDAYQYEDLAQTPGGNHTRSLSSEFAMHTSIYERYKNLSIYLHCPKSQCFNVIDMRVTVETNHSITIKLRSSKQDTLHKLTESTSPPWLIMQSISCPKYEFKCSDIFSVPERPNLVIRSVSSVKPAKCVSSSNTDLKNLKHRQKELQLSELLDVDSLGSRFRAMSKAVLK